LIDSTIDMVDHRNVERVNEMARSDIAQPLTHQNGAPVLTIPMQPARSSGSHLSAPTASVLVLGRSEKVLNETVDLIQNNGRAAGATNDFDNVVTLFDITSLDVVVFGGMVPPGTKEDLRTDLAAANPAITFVQGLAGIPGLIAAQVEAALVPCRRHPESIAYDGDSRTVTISIRSGESVRVIGFWHTAFVPPDPESASEVMFDDTMDPGTHTVSLPPTFPTAASFIVVHIGPDVNPFVVGAMPRGTTLVSAPA
jgi:hypothetical protein